MRCVAPPVDRPAIDRRTSPPGQGRGHGSLPGNGDPAAPEGFLGGRLTAQRRRGVAPVLLAGVIRSRSLAESSTRIGTNPRVGWPSNRRWVSRTTRCTRSVSRALNWADRRCTIWAIAASSAREVGTTGQRDRSGADRSIRHPVCTVPRNGHPHHAATLPGTNVAGRGRRPASGRPTYNHAGHHRARLVRDGVSVVGSRPVCSAWRRVRADTRCHTAG